MEAKEEIIEFDDFLKVYSYQKLFHHFYFQMGRKPNGRIGVISHVATIISLTFFVWFFSNNAFDIVRSIRMGLPTNQNIPVLSLSIFFTFRGAIMFFKRHDIEKFLNELDKELPRDLAKQKMIGVAKLYESYYKRHRYVGYYANVAIFFFSGTPPALYILEDAARDGPIIMEHQILAGYLPFGVRQIHAFYPLVWAHDVYIGTLGLTLLASFDNLFYIIQAHIKMHLDFLATRLENIDCGTSRKFNDDPEFYKKISQLIRHHQKLNRFCDEINELFKLMVLVSNFVASAGICVHLYLILEMDDLIMILRYLMPTVGLILFTFELCLRSTQLDEATSRLNTALYNQNWYMGSIKYQKLFLIWLKYAQCTKKLTAFGLAEIDMMHFSDIMRLAYNLLAFLKSH